jgi:hypothetical protein
MHPIFYETIFKLTIDNNGKKSIKSLFDILNIKRHNEIYKSLFVPSTTKDRDEICKTILKRKFLCSYTENSIFTIDEKDFFVEERKIIEFTRGKVYSVISIKKSVNIFIYNSINFLVRRIYCYFGGVSDNLFTLYDNEFLLNYEEEILYLFGNLVNIIKKFFLGINIVGIITWLKYKGDKFVLYVSCLSKKKFIVEHLPILFKKFILEKYSTDNKIYDFLNKNLRFKIVQYPQKL